jgi:ABC-type glycerol-3-phosphate transport system substrate-binding protein
MNVTRLSKVLILMALLAIGVACGPANPAGAPSAVSSTPSGAIQPSPAQKKPVTIEFWHVNSQLQGDALNALIDKFHKAYPYITVNATYQGSYSDIAMKINAAIEGKVQPDLAIAYQNNVATYAAAGVILPLDDLVKNKDLGFSDADLKDIFPSFIDKYPAYNNQTLSVSFNRSAEVMFTDLDLLKAANFTKPPETWDEFDAICKAVSKGPDQQCYSFVPSASTLASMYWNRGGKEILSADEKTVLFGDQPGLDVLRALDRWNKQTWAYQNAQRFGDQVDFGNGKVAFTFGSSAGIPFYDKAIKESKKPFAWTVSPMPRSAKDSDPVVDIYGPSIAVFKSTPEKQEADWLFVKYMLSKEANSEWIRATGYFPARQSTLDSLKDYIGSNPQYQAVLSYLKFGRTEPTSLRWEAVRNIIADMETAVFTGKATPEAALKDAVDKSNAELKK